MVRIVKSNICGVGKSLYVRRKKDKLLRLYIENETKAKNPVLRVPLHGPIVTSDEVVSQIMLSLENTTDQDSCCKAITSMDLQSIIVHIDIPEGVSSMAISGNLLKSIFHSD